MMDATPSVERLTLPLTPMMRQYREAKAQFPDAILMFRMGDFYEMFFEDAKTAARELDLTLTARDKGPHAIPMAGVPHHAVSGYVQRLIAKGHDVAFCDQVEDPKLARGLVRREVTRLVTPGTVVELEALEPSVHNSVCCVVTDGERVGLAFLELLTGELLCTQCPRDRAVEEIQRMGAREVIVVPGPGPGDDDGLVEKLRATSLRCRREESTDAEPDLACRAANVAVAYATRTQRASIAHLRPARSYDVAASLVVDETSRRNLELVQTLIDGKFEHSLLWHLDRCRTAMGSRLLRRWLLYPLRDRVRIEARLDRVEAFLRAPSVRGELQRALGQVRDLERLVGRIALVQPLPKDLAMLRDSLAVVPELVGLLAQCAPLVRELCRIPDAIDGLRQILVAALADAVPHAVDDSGLFRSGYDAALDELMALSLEKAGLLTELQERERRATGIASLRLRHNRVFGYYLEVTRANLGRIPGHYQRKQTLAGGERYITDELRQLEDKMLHAEEERRRRQHELFAVLVERCRAAQHELSALARTIARLDALLSLATVADEHGYCRPELVETPTLALTQCRHPVVERLLPARSGERFVPNDIVLDANVRQLLITGPNMAGKSTLMRQAALLTLMAHMGSFVPAARAQVGLCDRLLTRVGAADNLAGGLSTFMVEMLETATILRRATEQSLVIVDEVGRGTSTFDGVAIAWAVAEHLHEVSRCRVLFATHFHELTELADALPHMANASVQAVEQDGAIVFLRRLVLEPANRSYGIAVARLAGVPEAVLQSAALKLATLEQKKGGENVLSRMSV